MHRFFIALTLCCLAPFAARADEGQWMPSQIHELDAQKLAALGLELTPDQLYKEGDDQSLLRAVVNLSGCSAAFISKDGLISTNHHCSYRALQAASAVGSDLLTEGFFANARAQEIPGKGLTVKVLQSITDVTDDVRKVVAATKGDAERALAVERRQKEIVQACEAKGERTCQVASFYRGSLFQLFEYLELTDIRIVLAPPSAVGNYGGEIDNWMWPRHSVDFTLLRAYVGADGKPAAFAPDNKVYHPKRWLPVSPDGVEEGSFVATIGYPGHTDRYLSSAEVQRQLEQVFPTLVEVYGEWMAIQEELAQVNDTLRLKVAGRLRSLANRHKNARGMVDGITRMKLLERRQKDDAELTRVAKGLTPEDAQVPAVLQALSDERRQTHLQTFLLRTLLRGPDSIALAVRLTRWARERGKADLDRRPGYQDRDEDRLWRRIERNLGTYHPKVDEALLKPWLKRAQAAGIDLGVVNARRVASATSLFKKDAARKLFDAADAAALAKSKDPALKLAAKLVPLLEAIEARERAQTGRELLFGPRYFKLLKSVRSGPVYPDANSTLRFSYATVRGYSPRDGMTATPQTSLAGQIAKHRGKTPFNFPTSYSDKATDARNTYWADPNLEDLPVCFLASSDTTGGNSGSPVVDGRGRLVGLNFDRVWENIAGDFGYDIVRSRNVSVDIRYVLWMLEKVLTDGGGLLKEMELDAYVGRPRRPTPPPKEDAVAAATHPASVADANAPPKPEGCSQAGSAPFGFGATAVLLSLAARRRRRPAPV